MQLPQLISLVLSFTLMALASTASPGIHLTGASHKTVDAAKAIGFTTKAFLISGVKTGVIPAVNTTVKAPHQHTTVLTTPANATITFNFTDPNANTTTNCTDSWLQNSTAPNAYVLCALTNVTEYFSWKFTSYTAPDTFQIMFAHIFMDPVFGFMEYFSAATNFTLSCANATGSSCVLPASLSPVSAPIDAISG